MLIFPAIDLFDHQAVRLYQGDYSQMTVYSPDPVSVAKQFVSEGANQIHLVDLEGARSGGTPNLTTIARIIRETGIFCEVGGGIRNMEAVQKYLDAGVGRVILGSAAVENLDFLMQMLNTCKDKLAVGVDVRDRKVAIHGWTESTSLDVTEFCTKLQSLGVQTIICTDISRDGAMRGTSLDLYKTLQESLSMQIIASGGVSSMEDIRSLRALSLHGAIIGKAWYTGAISLHEAIEVAK